MCGAVEDDSGLSLAPLSPKVYALDGVPIQGVSGRDNLGLCRILCLQVRQKLDMVIVAVVRGEPGIVHQAR